MFPDMSGKTVAVTSDVRGPGPVVLEEVVFSLEEIFSFSDSCLEFQPILGGGKRESRLVNAGADEPFLNGIDCVVADECQPMSLVLMRFRKRTWL